MLNNSKYQLEKRRKEIIKMRTEIEWNEEENRHHDLHIALRIEFGIHINICVCGLYTFCIITI